MKAEQVIALAAHKTARPSPRALAELKKVCEHNDGAGHLYRVSAHAAMKLLDAHGFPCLSRSRLDRAARLLGRKSYAKK